MKPLQINHVQASRYTSDWWIGALSMIITDRGPGNGLQNGRSLFSMKSSNNSCENDPCSISQVRKPLTVYAGRIDQRSLRSNGMFSWGLTPFGDQPYFRWLVRSFAADSSTNMSWSGLYIVILCTHAALSSGFLCAARSWIRRSEIIVKIKTKTYQLLRLFNSLQHALNRLYIKYNTKYFPEIVYLFVDIQRWTFFKVFEKGLLFNVVQWCQRCRWYIRLQFRE